MYLNNNKNLVNLQYKILGINKILPNYRIISNTIRNCILNHSSSKITLGIKLENQQIKDLLEQHNIKLLTNTSKIMYIYNNSTIKVKSIINWNNYDNVFTINSLSCDENNKLYDYVGGFTDLTLKYVNIQSIYYLNELFTFNNNYILKYFKYNAKYSTKKISTSHIKIISAHIPNLTKNLSNLEITKYMIKIMDVNNNNLVNCLLSMNKCKFFNTIFTPSHSPNLNLLANNSNDLNIHPENSSFQSKSKNANSNKSTIEPRIPNYLENINAISEIITYIDIFNATNNTKKIQINNIILFYILTNCNYNILTSSLEFQYFQKSYLIKLNKIIISSISGKTSLLNLSKLFAVENCSNTIIIEALLLLVLLDFNVCIKDRNTETFIEDNLTHYVKYIAELYIPTFTITKSDIINLKLGINHNDKILLKKVLNKCKIHWYKNYFISMDDCIKWLIKNYKNEITIE